MFLIHSKFVYIKWTHLMCLILQIQEHDGNFPHCPLSCPYSLLTLPSYFFLFVKILQWCSLISLLNNWLNSSLVKDFNKEQVKKKSAIPQGCRQVCKQNQISKLILQSHSQRLQIFILCVSVTIDRGKHVIGPLETRLS